MNTFVKHAGKSKRNFMEEHIMHGRKQTVLRWIIAAIIFTACVLPASMSRSASGEWTWTGGSDTFSQAGIYGIKGTPDADNVPGARYGSAAWTDGTGSFWLFGGYGRDSAGNENLLNDLWRYDPDTAEWTWVSGSDTVSQEGIYGIKGTPDADNVPGGRYGSAVWTDASGKLWLFAGFGLDSAGTRQYLNDLWRYDPDTAEWTWMSGSDTARQTGVYGTQGTPAPDNMPGSRYESVAWTDTSTGDLWLFSGYGLNSGGGERSLNDLWRYDPDTAEWTWVGGSDKGDRLGDYGTKGTPDADNMPGSRFGSVAWTDGTGDLWLFGGYGYDAQYLNYLNDLWRYDPDTAEWTWISGSRKSARSGKYGAQGLTSANSVPGSRYESVAWMDGTGNLWLFGGYGYAGSGRRDTLNDLWRYDPVVDRWTWISGFNIVAKPGIYGTQGTPSGVNVPGARNGSVAWMGATGNLWLFGGYTYDKSRRQDYVNDLWRFELPADTNMRIDKATVTAGKTDTTDSITFSGFMDAGEDPLNAALGGEIVVSLSADTLVDPAAATFSFPLNADTFSNGKYKSPKADSAKSFSYDSAKGTMSFSAKNIDLTGLRCPIIVTIEIGAYVVQRVLQEDIVNGTKPCPLQLLVGVLDTLDVSKFKAKKGSAADTDSFEVSGTFTAAGLLDTMQTVDIVLGPDTFSVGGVGFAEKNGVYSCKNADSGNGIVTAKFDTLKCAFSIKVKNTTLSGSGDVAFGIDLFGNALPPEQVELPPAF
jgi:N-acetylneuraminic acid mutarotase